MTDDDRGRKARWMCMVLLSYLPSELRLPNDEALKEAECPRLWDNMGFVESNKLKRSVCISVPMAVPKTTAETLKHKINPSAGETFPQAVDVLLYTPGTDSFSLLAAAGF